MKYLIESMEHTYGDFKAWWMPSSMGYTRYLEEAGRYSMEEAEKICLKAGAANERMWREDDVLVRYSAGPCRTVIPSKIL